MRAINALFEYKESKGERSLNTLSTNARENTIAKLISLPEYAVMFIGSKDNLQVRNCCNKQITLTEGFKNSKHSIKLIRNESN